MSQQDKSANTDAHSSAKALDLGSQNKTPFHACTAEELLQLLAVDPAQGLGPAAVRKRRQQFGPNRLRASERRSIWSILFDQFKSVVILVLGIAGVVSLVLGEWAEATAILAVLLINTLIGFVSEWRAMRSMAALQRMGQDRIRVRREGHERDLSADKLVPGDIVLLEGGDVAPADIRLLEANNLQSDEAALTGESMPVNKALEAVAENAPLAERSDMLFKGTTLTQGSGSGLVVATGADTELGRIAELTEQAESKSTPLEQRLDALGRRLAWITLGVAAIVAAVGLLAGQPMRLMIETAIALGVAAIPEGLPIVATIALARGMWLMAQRNALINRLSAVETLGATRVILTDKTGTLTQNRMQLVKVQTPTASFDLADEAEKDADDDKSIDDIDPTLRRALEVIVLCNNAQLQDSNNDELGDPTEIAMLRAGADFGLHRKQLLEQLPEVREVSFDPEVMMMATYHDTESGVRVAVKGAPRAVLAVCDQAANDDTIDEAGRDQWLELSEQLAGEGLRVLAVAEKKVDNSEAEPYQQLTLLGLVGLLDPPRISVKGAVRDCQAAGMRVVMVTGDQAATARAIARQVGIAEAEDAPVYDGQELEEVLYDITNEQRAELREAAVFARVNPEQKLSLVDLYQEAGEIVAMTGDGVNDAPALKQADIGVAMGQQGTDAAREAADMVLQDDHFETIVAAVAQGRVIFSNIRKSVLFMLCTNVAEIIAVMLAAVVGAPLPLHPLQILYLNVITDVFPALALGVGAGDERVMQRPPRDPEERILTRQHWLSIGGWGVIIAASVLIALALALRLLGLSETGAVTVSFMTLGMTKLWFVFNLRDRDSTLWNNSIVRNPYIWGAIGLCLGLLLLAVYMPGLANLLQTQSPGWTGWGLIFVMSLLPLLAGQLWLVVKGRQHSR